MILAMTSAALLSAAAVAPADADPDWRVVTASVNDRQMMLQWVDRGSIARPDANIRTAWTYFVTMSDAIHARAQFDCAARRWEIDRISVEFPDGTVTEVPGSSGWKDVPYDRPIGRVLDFVCSGGTSATDLELAIAEGTPVAASREVLQQYAERAVARRENARRETQAETREGKPRAQQPQARNATAG
ncbi:hypothetical protein [Stakelama tenebrarum]|uniref:Uncharacterized protein n=1 Tax=Stakelama tenebrarum TaxID=2711215 RepID=A0A6G6Y8N0_9SPHN|nr:hypothetical protein [Sphingosinithalassobacter tenebrarum]QIG81285.1 hypothetical protein G5C33_16855 [Sphingosinithalassobacter tenebrarum]